MINNEIFMNKKNARVIAFYLPQFHPVMENDKWWGKGFTEWTNVGKAKPLFKGHYQPRVPADLGYYDLRMPEVRESQAKMAREAGVEGFCYWHYWFGNGKRILERPFDEVLSSGKPDFPFCLGWANESWTNKSWKIGTRKMEETVLLQQIYDIDDYKRHFLTILPALKDSRYITVDNKPLFLIYRPLDVPNIKLFMELWRDMAREAGLPGIHFVGVRQNMEHEVHSYRKTINGKRVIDLSSCKYGELLDIGFDAVNSRGYWRAEYCTRHVSDKFRRWIFRKMFNYFSVSKYSHKEINKYMYVEEDRWNNVYPTLFPNWDRSPRSGKKAFIYVGSTPELFREQLERALDLVKNKDSEHKILFLQSWNEWAEGNYVEPDLKYGTGYLDALKEMIISK